MGLDAITVVATMSFLGLIGAWLALPARARPASERGQAPATTRMVERPAE